MPECDICGKEFAEAELITGHGIRNEIRELIRKDFPAWSDRSRICRSDFDMYRVKYVSFLIEEETGTTRTWKTPL